ncbi:unnamed protein product [Clavelina lepadiformis]|uniref:Sulfotransferase n=1 Tax=Clavelina lepadiformis TaxID=159417 RepID=A0ABP0FNF9_CLALP
MKVNDLNIYRIGCFLYTKAAESALQDLKVSDESLPEFCVKTCETKNYPVAITGSSSGCFCVNTQSLYQATLIIMSTICFAPVRHLTAWRTRSSDPFCESKNFFEKSQHNIVGLVSFPGSGNSWLRQMLEMVTGIYTGSVYHDKNLHNTGLLGELLDWTSGKTLLVKDHLYPDKQETLERYSAIVLLIRNPYHALVAEFNRRKSQSHTGHANYSLFWSEGWSSYALSMVDLWKDSISLVLRRKMVTKLVFYEDLARDQEYEVRNIVNFLNFTKTPYFQRLFCLRTHKAELFKRESKFVQPFSTGLTNHINQAIKEIRVLLMNFGGKSWKSLPPYERESSDPDALIIQHGVARSEGIATKEARIKRRSGL